MLKFSPVVSLLTALLALAAVPSSQAASSAASSASDSLTTSSGSVSTSIQKSSNSSSKATGVAAGDYRIIDVATLPERPGMLRLQLQALADTSPDGELMLYLPQAIGRQASLRAGEVISAQNRPYGTQFSQGPAQQAFFLVLSDDWYQELRTQAVVL
jgi:hypothetical protein